MPLYEPFALVALGVFTGAYGIIIGAGGGFVLGPMLILIWRLEPAVAVGTSLTVVAVTSFSGALAYARSHSIDYRSGVLFALAALPGSVLGAVAAAKAPPGVITVSFGVLLFTISMYMALRPRTRASAPPAKVGAPRGRRLATRSITTTNGHTYVYSFFELPAVAFNVIFGVLSSFFGIGGGLMRVPLLVYAFGFPVAVAAATSIFSMSLYTGVGVVSHALLGNVDAAVLVFTGIGVVVGAQAGARIAPGLRAGLVLRLLAVGLGITGVWLMLHGMDVV